MHDEDVEQQFAKRSLKSSNISWIRLLCFRLSLGSRGGLGVDPDKVDQARRKGKVYSNSVVDTRKGVVHEADAVEALG